MLSKNYFGVISNHMISKDPGTDVSQLMNRVQKKCSEEKPSPFDYILGADIIYELQGFPELIKVPFTI